jgi:PKD repeat protein
MLSALTMRSLRVLLLIAGAALVVSCNGNEPSNVAPAATFAVRCAPLSCTFTNGSTDPDGSIDAYVWDFGDDSDPATTRDATHTYAAPGGRFLVKLTVTDDDGATATASLQVEASSPAPGATADFTFECTGLTCMFTNESVPSTASATLASYAWGFGDGEISGEPDPVHTYATGGTYTVGLNVIDDRSRTGHVSKQVVVVGPPALGPTAAFSASCTFLECRFTDETVSDVIVAWLWNFGDGYTSTEQHPIHIYPVSEPRTYTVTLLVTNTDLASGVTSRTVQVASSTVGTWTPLAPMPSPRVFPATAALNGTIYVAGGLGDNDPLSDILAYDPGTNAWRTAGTLRYGVGAAGAAALDGRIYVVGGQGAQGPRDDLQIFDPATGEVEAGPPLPLPMAWGTATVLDGRIHAFGQVQDPFDPFCELTCYFAHQVFDPSTGAWVTRAAPPSLYSAGSAVTIDGSLYLLSGGFGGHLARYDAQANTWTTLDGREGRQGGAGAVLGGRLYAIGGWTSSGLTGVVDRFDPQTGVWDQVRPMPTPRANFGAAVVGQGVYVVGGSVNNAASAGTERFTLE